MCTVEYYSAINKKNEIVKCSDKGKELGNILSEGGAQTDLGEQRSHVLSHLQYLAPNHKM